MLMWIEMVMVIANSVMKMICTMLCVNWMTPSSKTDMTVPMCAWNWHVGVVDVVVAAVAPEIALAADLVVVPLLDLDPDLNLIPLIDVLVLDHTQMTDVLAPDPTVLVIDQDPSPDLLHPRIKCVIGNAILYSSVTFDTF
jgi:hypothetical protein